MPRPRRREELERVLETYIRAVLDGQKVVGRLERLAVERHVRDLETADGRGLRFNLDAGIEACGWVEHRVRFSSKHWAGKPFILEGWQVFILASLFGWQRLVEDQTVASGRSWQRRFRVAYVSVARKNGKSELAAAIALLFLVKLSVAEAQIYSAATKRDQAALCWRAAASMAKRSPALRLEVKSFPSTYTMLHEDTGSRFQAVSSDANTLDGLGPLLAIVDELHAHPDRDVYDVLESGMGASREPLMLSITTAGEDRIGVCWDLESDCVKILEQAYGDEDSGDDQFAFIARIDEKDDPFNPAVWQKSNPNLGVSVFVESMQSAAKAAKRTPAALSEFRRKRLNDWVEKSLSWLPMPMWDDCDGPVDPDALRGEPCYVALDLSSTSDYTAGVAVFPRDDGYHVLPHFWIPDDTLFERRQKDRVPVNQWVADGLVTATSGNVVDYDAVKDWVISMVDRYDVAEIPMDPHGATKLQTEFIALYGDHDHARPRVISMRQGWVTMSPAIKATEVAIRKKRLHHGGHPVLRWMFSNVALKRGQNETLALHKDRSIDRIDGVVALVMAIGRAQLSTDFVLGADSVLGSLG